MAHHPSQLNQEPFHIELDGSWTLPDFGAFTRTFNQAYSIILVIEYEGDLVSRDRLRSAFTSHAWRGSGFSAANFYQEIRASVPRELRPYIQAIQYASPGYMDLALWSASALTVSLLVSRLVATFRHATDYYHLLYKQLHERKLTVIKTREEELNLKKKEADFLREKNEELAKVMGFEELERLRKLTEDELSTLKIQLGLFRYIRDLAKLEISGKAVLPKAPPKKKSLK